MLFAEGPLAPTWKQTIRAFQCPDFQASQMDGTRFGIPATGFGYNGHYLARSSGISYAPPTWAPQKTKNQACRKLRDFRQLTQTIVFADSAGVFCVDFACTASELRGELAPRAPSNDFPTVHFRHSDTANVAFLDGHVETRARNWRAPGFGDVSRMERVRLGYVGENLTDPLLQDEWYDRD